MHSLSTKPSLILPSCGALSRQMNVVPRIEARGQTSRWRCRTTCQQHASFPSSNAFWSNSLTSPSALYTDPTKSGESSRRSPSTPTGLQSRRTSPTCDSVATLALDSSFRHPRDQLFATRWCSDCPERVPKSPQYRPVASASIHYLLFLDSTDPRTVVENILAFHRETPV